MSTSSSGSEGMEESSTINMGAGMSGPTRKQNLPSSPGSETKGMGEM